MRAVRFHRYGAPDVLQLDEVPLPNPEAGQVLIDVYAAGVNFADIERRRGLYLANEPLPATTGFEGAGVVRGVGPGVDRSWVGREVAFLASASVAEACVASVDRLIPLPTDMSFVSGAAFPVQGLTAWHVLHTAAQVRDGDTVLVTAAAGGVGLLAVQLARRAGAFVIGVVSWEGKRQVVLEHGAHEVVVGDEALQLQDCVDVLLDSVGRDAAELGFRALRPFGRWVCFGEASGPAPAIAPARLLERSLRLSGWWLRTPHPAEVWARGVDAVLNELRSGGLRLHVRAVPFDEVPSAHAALESRRSTGKLVVQVR
ncbi:MAG: zinc-binding dehydrogenase [Myxococcaceae bacterium]|nr:zinc-binding dehydrogenase [Myxococcaceae bacterium]